jgi:hypothetical protein
MMRQRQIDRCRLRDVTATYTLARTMIPADVDNPLAALAHPLVCDTDPRRRRRRGEPLRVLGGMPDEKSSMYRRLVGRSG